MEKPTTTRAESVNIDTEAENTSAELTSEFNPRQILDIENIYEMRQTQHLAYDEALNSDPEGRLSDAEAEQKAEDAVVNVIDSYLYVNGLKPEDDQYQTYKDAVLGLSVTAIPEEDWYVKVVDKENYSEDNNLGPFVAGQAGRDKVRATYQNITGHYYYEADFNTPPTDDTEDEDTLDDAEPVTSDADTDVETNETVNPRIEALRNELDKARDELAALSAKRQTRLGGMSDNYAMALAIYNSKVIELGKLEKQDIIEDDTANDLVKKVSITQYLFDEQKKLRDASLEKINDMKVSKFVNWMNKGNVAVRIAKGAGLGLVAAGVGAGLGAAAGVAGVAAIGVVAATGATAAVRFARGFARSDWKNERGLKDLDNVHVENAQNSEHNPDVNYVDAIQNYFSKQLESDTKLEQQKRRRSVAAGIGGIAIGGAMGTMVQAFIDHGVFEGAANKLINGFDAKASPIDSTHLPSAPEDILPDAGDLNGDGVVDGLDHALAQEPAPDAAPEYVLDPNFVIEPGEGGIHFFQDIGLQERNWYEIQGELLQNFPNDFYAMSDGNVGLSHSGQLSIEAQQFIKARYGLAA